MADSVASTSAVPAAAISNGHITEDEASLYDRQIRLWGLEAQNRMRSSTVLLLSLRSLAHETIKNLVLAGIGRLIIMDDGVVTETDLGGGFLFREEDGAVGQERTAAAAPQIQSLNPLVSLTALPTLAPFVRDPSSSGASVDQEEQMVEFLKREKVDVVVACDMARSQSETIDQATRKAGTMFYSAGTYGFYGYVFADLGEEYQYLLTPPKSDSNPNPAPTKMVLRYPSLAQVADRSNWGLPSTQTASGGSPFRGLSRNQTKDRDPATALGLLAVQEYQRAHGVLPDGAEGQRDALSEIADELRKALGINEKVLPQVEQSMLDHLANHATHFFPPTLAVVGGLLAQDVLRAISKKDTPTVNLLCVDSMAGVGAVSRWAMDAPKSASP
nr:ThiF family [Naematelia aurantialba]